MADCFSLPNAVELVEALRISARSHNHDDAYYNMIAAADVIGQLVTKCSQLKVELDAVVDELKTLENAVGKSVPKTCDTCELWGIAGWSQYKVGYCSGDDNPHGAKDFCSRWRGAK